MPVGWCEIDKHAQKVYRAMYETEGEYLCDDATKINSAELPEIDLVCAGFPCQSFSLAGKCLGFRDTRGTLFFEVARIAREKRPSFLLLENVPGLLSHDKGRTLETIFTVLVYGAPKSLLFGERRSSGASESRRLRQDKRYGARDDEGYHLEWCVLDSKYYYVPQQRKRLFIVGFLMEDVSAKYSLSAAAIRKVCKNALTGRKGSGFTILMVSPVLNAPA